MLVSPLRWMAVGCEPPSPRRVRQRSYPANFPRKAGKFLRRGCGQFASLKECCGEGIERWEWV